jgi:hypothetical protein
MKNRVAWRLVGVLGVVVLVGGVVLATGYQRGRPISAVEVHPLPQKEWGFKSAATASISGGTIRRYAEWYTCGFFVVRVERSPSAEFIAALKRSRQSPPDVTPTG